MRKVTAISLLLVAMMCATSCTREDPFGASGFGALELRLGSGSAIRMETKAEADDLLDGLRFDNVLVVLTDNEGIVVGSVYKAYPYVPGASDLQDAVAESSVTQDIIHFDHLLPGNYRVYAYANIDAAQWQDSSDLISANEQTVAPGDDFTPYLSRELLALNSSDTSVPANPATKMLLTGQKTVSIGLAVASATVDLLRPVVRVKVTVKNNTPFPVTVDDLIFSEFSPDKAYLMDHLNPSGIPAVPDGVTYRALPAYPVLPASPSTVSAESEAVVYQTLVYENVATSPYKIRADFSMDRSSESLTSLQLSLGGGVAGTFGPISYDILNSLGVGEHVDVLIINPRIDARSGRLYYDHGDTSAAWESCGYNSYAGFLARAEAIYQNNSYTYDEWTQSSAYLAGWSGNDGDTPKTDNSFNYSGTGSQYFRTITKNNDGTYSIDGLYADNGQGFEPLNGISIEKGAHVKDKFSNEQAMKDAPYVRFKKENKTYLRSNFLYGETDVNIVKKSRLEWNSTQAATHHDNQYILFGYYDPDGDPGVPLKRILKENNKDVPLTYMARNEDINIVINVFYADQEGSITFRVDNSTWADDYSTTSSHTFN